MYLLPRAIAVVLLMALVAPAASAGPLDCLLGCPEPSGEPEGGQSGDGNETADGNQTAEGNQTAPSEPDPEGGASGGNETAPSEPTGNETGPQGGSSGNASAGGSANGTQGGHEAGTEGARLPGTGGDPVCRPVYVSNNHRVRVDPDGCYLKLVYQLINDAKSIIELDA